MPYYAGLDVSLRKTQVCIIDEKGEYLRDAKIDSDPEMLAMYLLEQGFEYELVGLEAGPLSQWLYTGMASAGLPVVCFRRCRRGERPSSDRRVV